MGKLLNAIMTIGVIYGIASFGDYTNINEFTKRNIYPRGKQAQESIVRNRLQNLEEILKRYPEEAASLRTPLLSTALSLQGPIADSTYASLVSLATEQMVSQPLTYQKNILESATALIRQGDYTLRKQIYDANDDSTKKEFFKEYIAQTVQTYKEEAKDALQSLWDGIKESYQSVKERIEHAFTP